VCIIHSRKYWYTSWWRLLLPTITTQSNIERTTQPWCGQRRHFLTLLRRSSTAGHVGYPVILLALFWLGCSSSDCCMHQFYPPVLNVGWCSSAALLLRDEDDWWMCPLSISYQSISKGNNDRTDTRLIRLGTKCRDGTRLVLKHEIQRIWKVWDYTWVETSSEMKGDFIGLKMQMVAIQFTWNWEHTTINSFG